MLLGRQLRASNVHTYWLCRTGALSSASWLQGWQQVRKVDSFLPLIGAHKNHLGRTFDLRPGQLDFVFRKLNACFYEGSNVHLYLVYLTACYLVRYLLDFMFSLANITRRGRAVGRLDHP